MATRRERKLTQAVERIRALNSVLAEDILLGIEWLKKYADEVKEESFDVWRCAFWTKLAIRTFFGQVDGVSYAMRASTVEMARDLRLPFSEKDLLRLEEKRRLDDGTVVPRLLPPDESLKLAWRFFPLIFDSQFEGDTSGAGWQAFRVLKKVRNAFTHPETIDDLAAQNGLSRIQPCTVWFHSEMARLFAEALPDGMTVRKHQPLSLEKLKGLTQKSPIFDDTDYALISDSAGMSLAYFHHGVLGMLREVGWAFNLVWDRASLADLQSNEGQFALRNFVRTIDSVLQGIASFMRRYLRDSLGRGDTELNDVEKEILETKGETLEDFVAMLNLWSRKIGSGEAVQEKGDRFLAFKRLLSRRDRLIHPKRLSDLMFGTDALSIVMAASDWYWSLTDLMKFDTKSMPRSVQRDDTSDP